MDRKFRKIRKTDATFHMSLSDEQKNAKRLIYDETIKIGIMEGAAGSGKTALCANIALDMLIKGHVDKIIITRPTIIAAESNDIGFLPGDAMNPLRGKMAPFLLPILGVMKEMRAPKEIDDLITNEKIVVLPLQFARGFNLRDTILICDEAQNVTPEVFKLLFTRICENSKILMTVDSDQIDLKNKSNSCYSWIDKVKNVDEIAHIKLSSNYRDPLVAKLLEIFKGVVKEEKKWYY